jgi:lysophospholipid acyltransferase (LPLAT)-like uncharacterized protein
MLLAALLRLWLRSLRIQGPASLPERGILALWHEDLPACMAAFARRRIAVLISLSRDGALAASLCQGLGYRVVRGSSTRGGLGGLKALARCLSGRALEDSSGAALAGMALDGPRGPRGVAKEGTLWLAHFTGTPIYPIRVRAHRFFRAASWDRTIIPLPFSRVEVALGEACFPASSEELSLAMAGAKISLPLAAAES